MWIALIIIFVFLIFLFICLQIAFSIVLPKKRTLEQTKTIELENDSTIFDFYEKALSKTYEVKSRFDYNLKLYYFLNNSKKFIVIAHGHTYTHHGCLKYARMMLNKGYNVITYDQRYHGLSGGKNTTLGFYEKFDLYDIISHLYSEFGDDIYLGTYGESMGAATILLEQELDKRVRFCISDCAFSDLGDLIKSKVKSYHLPRIFYFFTDLFVKLITGIRMKEVSPIKVLEKSTVPILFVHGKQDVYIPYEHSLKMYEDYLGPKQLFIATNNAGHAVAYYTDTEEYEKAVSEFMKEFNL
jgi:uncharacterized protein